MLSPTDLIAEGLRLSAVPEPPVPCPPHTVDAITGVPITEGYVAHQLAGANTVEFLETFRGNQHGYVSVNTARCWRAQNPRGDNRASRSVLAFGDGTAWLPMIARDTATTERPCWSDLVRQVWPARAGQPCVAIVTTDQKKRLWPRARATQLGDRTAVYLYNPESRDDGVRFVDWPSLIACLDLVETVYGAGLVKPWIATNVLAALAQRGRGGDPRTLLAWERALAPWRVTEEFPLALLLAQKPTKEIP